MSMDYKTLKRHIVNASYRVGKNNVSFKIDINSLNNNLTDLELVCIPFGDTSRRIKPEDLPLITEYYREDKMAWISDEKYITSLIFVDSNKIDENLTELIEDLKVKHEDDPDIDHSHIIGEILGSYPCYLALVVAYQNNSPNSVGKNSYFLACRANKVIIKDPEYVYSPNHTVSSTTSTTSTESTSTDSVDEDDVIEDGSYDE